ncbi:MAG: SNF2-related protein [Candidatus Absconditabacterales bacterium]|nr:SNF2-related protein [Candidatus Absconditabacterales bacterium]
MSYSVIKDNYKNGSVGDFLKEVINKNSEISIVSAYFTIYAYYRLKENLDEIKKLKFLFGEPTFIKSIDPENKNTRDYKIEDDKLVIPIESRLSQKKMAKECAEWLKNKVEIRSMVKPNFLHGKLYHVIQESGIEKAIAGSSNFTVNGLGLGGSNNIELNLIVDSDRERKELKDWFENIWNDKTGLVEDVKDEVLKYLDQLYVENDPEFIYFKTIYHIFENYLSEQKESGFLDEKTGFYDSEIWETLYDFQKDGVKGAINKILKHNGCIIADSVGLGKTYEALAIIKYFELLNGRVLVICPKKLSSNWTIYQANQNNMLNPFKKDRFNYSVLFHTDMGRETGKSTANNIDLENFNWGTYNLVVIDESHNFRGNPVEKVKDDGSSRMNRSKWLMEKIIKSNSKTKVLLLSATPVNNSLKDLRNQISFITEENDNALFEHCKIKSIRLTLENAQKNFTKWSKNKNENKSMKQLLENLDTSFFKLLDELTIARSRKHIVNYYDLKSVGNFPKREKPYSVYPEIDTQKRFPSYDSINKQISEYKLSVFNPSEYIKEEKKKKYESLAGNKIINFKQEDREHFLIGMMKVNFLKRLESSIESFEISLERTIKKIEDLENKIADFQKMDKKSQEENFDFLTPSEEEIEEVSDEVEAWQVGKKLKFDLSDLKLNEWLENLKKDKEALINLMNNAKVVTPDRDAKLQELKNIIKQKIQNPINPENKKVLIFTAFADTAMYLYDNLEQWINNDLKLHCGLVCGSNTKTTFGKNYYDSILLNFSPKSKNRNKLNSNNQTTEIDILFATDCISEGQNLQDCDFLINYDIHWNPVRIIQRFGRIDRLGSINKTVKLVNFWPTNDLDNYINLKERVECRMALVDVTATGEDNILANDQIDLINDDLKYRNKQLKKLQNEILDIEDMDESISLTDFTLDDFRVELLNYIENNKLRLRESPLGLYAVVPSPSGEYASLIKNREISENVRYIIKPGVIFCLYQKKVSSENELVNPLNPYFLIYIRDDGTVRYNYTNAKQILEIFRLLCQNEKQPYNELCRIFNTETENGKNMDKYSTLLTKAVTEITNIYKKKGNALLTSDRGATLIPIEKQINGMKDFELVTWLLIR